MSSIARQTFARTARSVNRSRAPLCSSSRIAGQQSFRPHFLQQPQTVRAFSATMIPKSDAVASPAPKAEFDKEIVDMADYATNYKVTSELAVSGKGP